MVLIDSDAENRKGIEPMVDSAHRSNWSHPSRTWSGHRCTYRLLSSPPRMWRCLQVWSILDTYDTSHLWLKLGIGPRFAQAFSWSQTFNAWNMSDSSKTTNFERPPFIRWLNWAWVKVGWRFGVGTWDQWTHLFLTFSGNQSFFACTEKTIPNSQNKINS